MNPHGLSAGRNHDLRTRIEQAVSRVLSSLEPSHYPASLLASMTAVLQVPRALRGLPLLLEASKRSPVSETGDRTLAGAESMLRGLLLLCEMSLERSSRPQKALGSRLGRQFPEAHLLLTADTLITWPFELFAGVIDTKGRPVTASVAAACGPDKLLAGLEAGGADLQGILALDPVGPLVKAIAGIGAGGGLMASAAGWVWLRECADWFGNPPVCAGALKDAGSKLRTMLDSKLEKAAEKRLAVLIRALFF